MNNISEIVKNKKEFFNSFRTFEVNYRIFYLKKLKEVIKKKEQDIFRALQMDLGKSEFESFMCEIGLVYDEINYMLKHIKKLSKVKKVATPLALFRAKSYILPSPYGVVLIMSPWNYPFLLTMDPLVDAIATGNVVVVKPSNYSKNTSIVINNIITEVFDENYVSVVLGGREENQELLNQKFDYIFFTGGKKVGELVLEKASKYLTPVTLELGGKSPCIVTNSSDIKLAAKRIVFGKYLNLGQTCVAPDYCLVDSKIYNEFIECLKKEIFKQFPNALDNSDYGKIINKKHLERLSNLLVDQNVFVGGEIGNDKITPTVLTNVKIESDVMQEEIFGPILPVLKYDNIKEVYDIINRNPTPLALYLFSNDKTEIKNVMNNISFGGGCVNDVITHLATSNMAFGGVGSSGMGSYHGKKGFETFTHYKSILNRMNWIDLSVRYQPYNNKKKSILKRLMK